MARQSLAVVLAFCLLANGFCYPHMHRQKRADGDTDQSATSEDPPTTTEQQTPSSENPSVNEVFPSISDDDDDDGFETMNTSSTGDGGSNIFSLLRIAGAILPSSSNSREDGQSDLGSLLATISGIVANLSGDGIDLNALIASGIGLFVGLLSEGEENPGAVIASYLLTSLDTITGGGSKNNGAFFGTFLSKLVKGISAIQDSADAPSPLWTLKLDILRAVVQFATTVLGMASSSVFSSSFG